MVKMTFRISDVIRMGEKLILNGADLIILRTFDLHNHLFTHGLKKIKYPVLVSEVAVQIASS